MEFATVSVLLSITLQPDYASLVIIYVQHAIKNLNAKLVFGDLSLSIILVYRNAQMVLILIHSLIIRIANNVANHAKNVFQNRYALFAKSIIFCLKENVF